MNWSDDNGAPLHSATFCLIFHQRKEWEKKKSYKTARTETNWNRCSSWDCEKNLSALLTVVRSFFSQFVFEHVLWENVLHFDPRLFHIILERNNAREEGRKRRRNETNSCFWCIFFLERSREMQQEDRRRRGRMKTEREETRRWHNRNGKRILLCRWMLLLFLLQFQSHLWLIRLIKMMVSYVCTVHSDRCTTHITTQVFVCIEHWGSENLLLQSGEYSLHSVPVWFNEHFVFQHWFVGIVKPISFHYCVVDSCIINTFTQVQCLSIDPCVCWQWIGDFSTWEQWTLMPMWDREIPKSPTRDWTTQFVLRKPCL